MVEMTLGERRDVLGVLAKWPTPGQVKTRLAAVSSPEWAARLAEAFLYDILERLDRVSQHKVLAFSPADAEKRFLEATHRRCELIPQQGDDLGERMQAFFRQQFEKGAEKVALIGTDSPTLPVAMIEQAFTELNQADVVLGPATDGGYYLIGMVRERQIFKGMHWGSADVLLETIQRLSKSNCRLALLPPWYDVDTLEDCRMLQGHIAAMRRANIDPGIPRTAEVLSAIDNQP